MKLEKIESIHPGDIKKGMRILWYDADGRERNGTAMEDSSIEGVHGYWVFFEEGLELFREDEDLFVYL